MRGRARAPAAPRTTGTRRRRLPPCQQLQRGPREVHAPELRLVGRRHGARVELAPQTPTNARRGAAGAPRPLIGRGAGDPLELEAIEADRGIEPRHAAEPRVDDAGHAVDRDRGLGHVGRQYHLSFVGLPQDAVLLLGGEVAVELHHQQSAQALQLGERLARLPDLADPGRNTKISPGVSPSASRTAAATMPSSGSEIR